MFKNIYMEQLLLYCQSLKQNNSIQEVPVAALIEHNNQVIAISSNRTIELNDPTAHAEIIVIQQAAQHFSNYRLDGCTIYCTLEPCPMCLGAIKNSRIKRLYFGAYAAEQKFTALNYKLEIYGGIYEEECVNLLQQFFQDKRNEK